MGGIAQAQSRSWNAAVSRSTLPARLSVPWMVRKLLAAAFLISLLQYWIYTVNLQYVHVAFLLLAGLVVLAGTERQKRLQNLLSGGALFVVALLFTEVISYYSGDSYSLLYGAALIMVLIMARLIVQQVGLHEVLRAYYQAGVLITIFLAFAGRKAISGYTAGERFTGNGGAHPNLVAFLLAGYLPAMIWRTLEYPAGRKRTASAAVSLLNFVLIFLSGSRGSLLAVLMAGGAVGLRLALSGKLKGRMRVRHLHLILFLVALPLVSIFLVQHGRIEKVGGFFDTALSLTSSQRGLRSGFSGRTTFWALALHRLNEEQRWLFGFGFRMGDALVGTIDNGYLQLLFETGLISGVLIFGVLIGVFVRLWRLTRRRENTAWFRYHYVLWATIVVYLVNNISTRYLLSFGNGFSLLILFLMVASRKELQGGAVPNTAPGASPRSWQPRAPVTLPSSTFRH